MVREIELLRIVYHIYFTFSFAGSTDCVCFATVGVNDPVTSALHIVVGKAFKSMKTPQCINLCERCSEYGNVEVEVAGGKSHL